MPFLLLSSLQCFFRHLLRVEMLTHIGDPTLHQLVTEKVIYKKLRGHFNCIQQKNCGDRVELHIILVTIRKARYLQNIFTTMQTHIPLITYDDVNI